MARNPPPRGKYDLNYGEARALILARVDSLRDFIASWPPGVSRGDILHNLHRFAEVPARPVIDHAGGRSGAADCPSDRAGDYCDAWAKADR